VLQVVSDVELVITLSGAEKAVNRGDKEKEGLHARPPVREWRVAGFLRCAVGIRCDQDHGQLVNAWGRPNAAELPQALPGTMRGQWP
jgi:hypothetical protein